MKKLSIIYNSIHFAAIPFNIWWTAIFYRYIWEQYGVKIFFNFVFVLFFCKIMHVYVDRSTIRILNALILWSKLLPSKNAEMDEFNFEMSEKDSSWQFNLHVYRLIYSSGLASKKKQKFLEIIIYYFCHYQSNF